MLPNTFFAAGIFCQPTLATSLQCKALVLYSKFDVSGQGLFLSLWLHAQKRDRGRKTLILNLDNTLIVNATETRGDHDFTIIASFKDSDIIKYMHIRPWVDALLGAASQHFEIGVFTAATAEYACEIHPPAVHHILPACVANLY